MVLGRIMKLMFRITCDHCEKSYLVGTSAIIAFANRSGGPEALVACPVGHQVHHDFHTDTSSPVPTGDRQRVAAAA